MQKWWKLGNQKIFVILNHVENKHPYILHSQYLGCWWPGDGRSQDIGSHDIDLLLLKHADWNNRRYTSLASGKMTSNKKKKNFQIVLSVKWCSRVGCQAKVCVGSYNIRQKQRSDFDHTHKKNSHFVWQNFSMLWGWLDRHFYSEIMKQSCHC